MSDGARSALGGYLYQFIGAAGLSARAQNWAGASPPSGQVPHAQVLRGTIVHEQDDMDVVVRLAGGRDAVGVQFKYSRETPPRPIEGSELIEILDAFHRSAAESRDHRFVEYVLIANRAFARSAQSLFETGGAASPDRRLFPQAVKGKRAVKAAQRALVLYGDATQAANSRHAILSRLTTELGVSEEAWVDQVRTLASRHGLLPFEFEDALGKLVGQILRRTTGKPLEVTVEFLNRCLHGVPDARPLDLSAGAGSAHKAARDALSTAAFGDLVEDETSLVRRRLMEEVEKQAALHTIVFLVGNGGSGKSVLAAQFLKNEAARRFVTFVAAGLIADDWLGRTLNEWRSPAYFHDLRIESIDRVIERLRHANPGASQPILILDLDGIDEVAADQRHAARWLINQFLRMGRSGATHAVLLVTCRTTGGDVEKAMPRLLGDWFFTDATRRLTDAGRLGSRGRLRCQ